MSIPERWKGHPSLPRDLADRLGRVVDRLRGGGAQLVYLFGSAAEPASEPAAADGPEPGDLDLAVWGLEEDRWAVLTDLADILGTDRIDLVLLEEAGPELRYRVIADGRLLYSAAAGVENRVELAILREYQDLVPFRRTQMHYVRERHENYGP